MKTIVCISGSLRQKSINTILLKTVTQMAGEHCRFIMGQIHEIPLYNGDVEENEGIPSAVSKLKDEIAAADGLLLVSPEYNNSIPGVLKNAIDWLSRPAKDIGRVFVNKPVGIIGATAGNSGTRFCQTAWLPVFRCLKMRVWFGGSLYLDGFDQKIDENGQIIDTVTKKIVESYVTGFVGFVEASK